jgi:hypothetical protein
MSNSNVVERSVDLLDTYDYTSKMLENLCPQAVKARKCRRT